MNVEQHGLPSGEELARLRDLPESERPTYQDIGDRYGVSRQAVHKALTKWRKNQEQKRSAP